jgi:TorA maturation chaperone TorD
MPDKGLNELPDHLVSELEFLHFMAFQQARIEARGGDGSHYLRGQRDFIERQLGRWLPKLVSKLNEQNAQPFFSEVLALLLRFVQYEQHQLVPASIIEIGDAIRAQGKGFGL